MTRALLVSILLVVNLEAFAQRRMAAVPPAPHTATSCSNTDLCAGVPNSACIQMNFVETAWRTCVANRGRRGLVIGPSEFMKAPDAPWLRVIGEASIAEIFVPYHASSNLRLYDSAFCEGGCLRPVVADDAGPNGSLFTLPGAARPQVVAEVRDRGMAWLCKGPSQFIRRRGRELLLWGVYDAGNYDYLIEYGFRDDGTLTFRVGATGWNHPDATTEAHMHNVVWRVDVDLNGGSQNSAVTTTHLEGMEPFFQAIDVEAPFNEGREGTLVWDPVKFTTIGVEDASTNERGHNIGYVIRPQREGLSRHFGRNLPISRKEHFTESDMAVTRYSQAERDAFFGSAFLDPDQYILGINAPAGIQGVANAEPVTNANIVLWYRTSTHHEPHDEDYAIGDPTGTMNGITLMHWTGFELEPRNLSPHNPLGGPSRDQCMR